MVVGTVDMDISASVTLTLTITPHLAYYYPYDMTKKTCLDKEDLSCYTNFTTNLQK